MQNMTKRPATFHFEDHPEAVRDALQAATAELIAVLRSQIRAPHPQLLAEIEELGTRIHGIAGDGAMLDACTVAAKCLGNYPVACCLFPAWKGIGTWAEDADA
jgi:actin-like ATPase involved in cell morphogenesis